MSIICQDAQRLSAYDEPPENDNGQHVDSVPLARDSLTDRPEDDDNELYTVCSTF